MTRIEVLKLTVTRGGRPIVADVDLALPERGLVGILGPNGAGKSTLARLLAGQPGASTGRRDDRRSGRRRDGRGPPCGA
jgi:iron complex transport system ATP-binding protein